MTAPKTAVTVPPAKKTVPTAPCGVPKINKWTLNSDNTISGFISGSNSFNDGAPVTTSPIVGSAISGSVVQTKSSSRYFLGEEIRSRVNMKTTIGRRSYPTATAPILLGLAAAALILNGKLGSVSLMSYPCFELIEFSLGLND